MRDGFLEPEVYRLILEALTEEIKPVFVVAYHLGMRTGELLALNLKRSWVDLMEASFTSTDGSPKIANRKQRRFMATWVHG